MKFFSWPRPSTAAVPQSTASCCRGPTSWLVSGTVTSSSSTSHVVSVRMTCYYRFLTDSKPVMCESLISSVLLVGVVDIVGVTWLTTWSVVSVTVLCVHPRSEKNTAWAISPDSPTLGRNYIARNAVILSSKGQRSTSRGYLMRYRRGSAQCRIKVGAIDAAASGLFPKRPI